jgi:hypothetical protein
VSAGRAGADLSSRTRRLLLGGAVAGPMFVTTFLAEGANRADYQASRHPVSSLALGPGGWRQTVNFAVAGGLYLGFAVGLSRSELPVRSRGGPILIGAVAVGLLGSAAFVTDPVSGYPPGTSPAPTRRSTAGLLHDLAAVPVFLGLPTAELIYASRFHRAGDRGWAAYSAGSAVAMLAALGPATIGFSQDPRFVSRGGLFQRAGVIAGLGWLTALAVRSLRTSSPRTKSAPG